MGVHMTLPPGAAVGGFTQSPVTQSVPDGQMSSQAAAEVVIHFSNSLLTRKLVRAARDSAENVVSDGERVDFMIPLGSLLALSVCPSS